MKNAILILAAICFCCPLVADQPAAKTPAVGPQTELAPMRDGVKLSTSVFLPEGTGPWPAILQRTPYGKSKRGEPYVSAGYAYISQDQRGRGDSEGEYRPHEAEIEDSYDTVEWIASQPWCNGKVGMVGASASGIAANLAAASGAAPFGGGICEGRAAFAVLRRTIHRRCIQRGRHRQLDAPSRRW